MQSEIKTVKRKAGLPLETEILPIADILKRNNRQLPQKKPVNEE